MLLDAEGKIALSRGIQLKPYTPRKAIPRAYMTDAEILAGAGGDLILDTESFPNYFLAGFKHVQSGKYIKTDAVLNPRFLSWLLFSYRTIGFNSEAYDLPMLWAAYVNPDTEFLKHVSNALIGGNRVKEVETEYNFKCYPLGSMKHIDLFDVCPLRGSLKLYGARLHSPRIQDLPIPDSKHLTPEEIEIVIGYNGNDLDVTEQIFKFCSERLELRASISAEYNEDLMSKSDAQMAEIVIAKEVAKLNGKWVKRPEIEAGTVFKYKAPSYLQYATPQMQSLLERIRHANFMVQDNGKIQLPAELNTSVQIGTGVYRLGIGGLHSSEENVAHTANEKYCIIDRDVKSYYPKIITTLGLYPIAMGPNFLVAYNGFIDKRLVAKARKEFTRDKGLKIFINGVTGKLSDIWSKMYSPDLTIQVTVTGQLALLLKIEMLECQGFQVISANTDGIVIYCARNKVDELNRIIKQWETITGFETEDIEYSGYYARDVNAYFAVKLNGETKVKGPYSEVGSQSGTQLDNNPIMLICSDAIKLLLSKAIPIEETVRACTDLRRFVVVRQVKGGAAFRNEYLGKVVRWYHSTKSNDSIHYVLTGNKVAMSDNCIPCMDLPNGIPSDLNYQYYVDKATETLYDIGYIKRARQLEFF